MTAPLTPDTLATIRRNAGKVPPIHIADTLGWPLAMLHRVARDKLIDLTMEPPPRDDSHVEPLSAREAVHPELSKPYARPRSGRTEIVTVRLRPSDMRILVSASDAHRLERGPALARMFENARERGLIEELMRLPAPLPRVSGEGA